MLAHLFYFGPLFEMDSPFEMSCNIKLVFYMQHTLVIVAAVQEDMSHAVTYTVNMTARTDHVQ